MTKSIALLFLITCSASAFSAPPISSKFELSRVYSSIKNPEKFEHYMKQINKMDEIQKSTDSLVRALSPICKRGLKLVEALTPMIIESKGYTYNDEYSISYANGLVLKAKNVNYDVECTFSGHKEGDDKSKIKATYTEKIKNFSVLSVTQKIVFK